MAKYTVNFSCGHSEVKQLFGKCSERERTISYWEQSGICSDCYKAQQSQQLSEKSASLPILEGSEKQISWALKIRLQMIDAIQDTINSFERGRGDAINAKLAEIGRDGMIAQLKAAAPADKYDAALATLQKHFNAIDRLNQFKTTTSARWIIDNRI